MMKTLCSLFLNNMLLLNVSHSFQSEDSILRYTTCDPASPTEPDICAEDMLVNTGAPEPEVGYLVDFMSEQSSYLGTSTVRGYAVTAYLDESTCRSFEYSYDIFLRIESFIQHHFKSLFLKLL